jgi:hypothetical protein
VPERQTLNQVIQQAISHSIDHALHADEFRRRLREGIEFVEDLQRVLNPLVDENGLETITKQYRDLLANHEKSANPQSWIWRHRSVRNAFLTGEKGGRYWPIYMDAVAGLCQQYLEKRWLHCQLLDHLLIDALIYQEGLSFGEQVKEALLGGGLISALSASNQNFYKAQRRKMWKDSLQRLVIYGLLLTILSLVMKLIYDQR